MSATAPQAIRKPPRSRSSRGELLDSYLGDERARRISQRYLPSREAIVEILESVLDLDVSRLLRAAGFEPRQS